MNHGSTHVERRLVVRPLRGGLCLPLTETYYEGAPLMSKLFVYFLLLPDSPLVVGDLVLYLLRGNLENLFCIAPHFLHLVNPVLLDHAHRVLDIVSLEGYVTSVVASLTIVLVPAVPIAPASDEMHIVGVFVP